MVGFKGVSKMVEFGMFKSSLLGKYVYISLLTLLSIVCFVFSLIVLDNID